MKNRKLTHLSSLLASLALAQFGARAQNSFVTIDDYQFIPGALGASAGEIATDFVTGAIFTAGSPQINADGRRAAEVRGFLNDGQPWATVDQFPPVGSDLTSTAHYQAVATGPGGVVLASGYLADRPSLTQSWLVRRSNDGGGTWGPSDLFNPGTGLIAACGDIKVSRAGDIYAAGFSETPDRVNIWLVKKLSNGGTTWQISDSIAGPRAQARAIAINPTSGAIFVVGHIGNPKLYNADAWTVRRSTDFGAHWVTVQTLQDTSKPTASRPSGAEDVAIDARTGAIYVAGYYAGATKKGTINYWLVQRSIDGGATWTTVDSFTPTGITTLSPCGLTVDSNGTVFVAGYTSDENTTVPQHWVVRKGINGTSWSTIDDYQYVAGQNARANGIEVDGGDNVYVTGRARDGVNGTTDHWITRKLAK